MQNQEQACKEKQSDLKEIHYSFQDKGKRLEGCLIRLTTIGNTLSDESNALSAKIPSLESSPRMPGIVNDLINDSEEYGDLIGKIESQISKLEKFI